MNFAINTFCLFPGSTRSLVYTYQSGEKSRYEVGQGNLKLTFSTDQEKYNNYVNMRNLVCNTHMIPFQLETFYV